jgi:hypothetical protein
MNKHLIQVPHALGSAFSHDVLEKSFKPHAKRGSGRKLVRALCASGLIRTWLQVLRENSHRLTSLACRFKY